MATVTVAGHKPLLGTLAGGEKQIARAALEARVPLIVLLENGFAPLYKPPKKYFEACSAGRPLMLAPWPHHDARQSITRAQCLALNDFSARIRQDRPGPVPLP